MLLYQSAITWKNGVTSYLFRAILFLTNDCIYCIMPACEIRTKSSMAASFCLIEFLWVLRNYVRFDRMETREDRERFTWLWRKTYEISLTELKLTGWNGNEFALFKALLFLCAFVYHGDPIIEDFWDHSIEELIWKVNNKFSLIIILTGNAFACNNVWQASRKCLITTGLDRKSQQFSFSFVIRVWNTRKLCIFFIW